jgi:molybdopterin synthase catalytic subunit
MDLSVRLFAALRERAGTGEIVLCDLPEALDLAGLKREIERRYPRVGSLAHVAGVVGTEYVRDAHVLSAGDEVSLLPPVSGGAPGPGEGSPIARDADADLARGIFELSPLALDPAPCAARVVHSTCGASVTFTGSTRDTNRGKPVVELHYEAFEAMTGPEMARIFAACRGELAADDGDRALRMLCQHRVGRVRVGEPSVVIAVASPHRDLAFRACRFLIDALKQTLPIWKKEIYADGHFWIGDRS